MADHQGSVSKLWQREMPGLVTDLNVSADAKRVLVTMIPDPEGLIKSRQDRWVREPVLAFLNEDGEVLWQKSLSSRPKWQSLSTDASFIAVSTYEGKLIALDPKGAILWEKENYCRPVILEHSKSVLCFRGDDAKPSGVAFDVYSAKGELIRTHKVSHELLEAYLSQDESRIVLGLANGLIQVLDAQDFQMRWEAKVSSDVVAVSAGSGAEGVVAVLNYQRDENGKHMATVSIFKANGTPLDQVSTAGRFESLAISADSNSIVLYGNNPFGQALVNLARNPASASVENQPTPFAEAWRQSSPRYSDYSSPLSVVDGGIIAGFEDPEQSDSKRSMAHLFSFGKDGKVEWTIPMVTEEGGYLFSYSKGAGKPVLVGVSDLGVLSAYRLESR